MLETGCDTTAPKTIHSWLKMNCVCAVNAQSMEVVKTLLVTQGQQIARADLHNGVQADKNL